MDDFSKDERFAHIPKDPKFRRIPKSERKVKIDKRFRPMLYDQKFVTTTSIDKRGRPLHQSSTENLKKFYHLSSDEEFSGQEDTATTAVAETKKLVKKQKKADKTKQKNKKLATVNDDERFNVSNLSSDKSGHKSKESETESSAESDNESDENKEELQKNEKQLFTKKKDDKKLDAQTKKKLRDLTIDYARGEGVLMSSSSSDDESDEEDNISSDDGIEHAWGELDKDAETTEESTARLAACNLDWDRIRASDLMVLFNSFLPTGAFIHSVTIYPSEFGLKRMQEEEVKGPIELVESNHDKDNGVNNENEEGSHYHMEKLRQYQLNRLKYYYAVIVFDSVETASKVYSECDGIEYESSATKLDLRFIPNDMTFDQEPKEVCTVLPDLTQYKPRLFTNTALQQVKVDCTWDETNPERKEISAKLNSGKVDDIDRNDIKAYLASGTSDDESEDEVQKQLKKVDADQENKNTIEKYKSLLQSIEEAQEEKKKKDVQLEFTWGVGTKEKAEKLVEKKMKEKVELTPFEKYLEKRREKRKAKRNKKNSNNEDNDLSDSDSDDSIPSDIDMNDPYFAEEFKNRKPPTKKKKLSKDQDIDSAEEEEKKKQQAELELIMMDDETDDKHHFNMKRIEEAEAASKSKKKRLSKKKKDLQAEAVQDSFTVDVHDPRFADVYSSHMYNIDPTDPHYRKTKGTEAIIQEKLKKKAYQSTNYVSTFISYFHIKIIDFL
ncbi:unnamed protein product [Trichogramma brassicae]|uniref:Uncharacterized protein n=1 Tax=Trichogramma brassicae TaxID=86971 RepID=A0A6H5HZ56_9HYME|nr:unnamed protein product [Trichogramma brassicae]